jgi:hypothetical protein
MVKVCLNAEPELLVEDPAVVEEALVETELAAEELLLEDTEPLELKLREVLGLEDATAELEVEDAVLVVVTPVLVVVV